MASAPPSFSSTKETTNYARLCRLLVDVGTQALRDTFDRIHPPTVLHGVLKSPGPVHTTLQSLRKKKILNATQWGKLYPTISSSVSSAHFDITLLMVLLRNICGLTPPTTGWDNLPPATDMSVEANIARVKFYRNNVYGHASQASVDDPTFNTSWLDISNALVGLGARAGINYGAGINKLKAECMDPDIEIHYKELLKEWKKDDDSIKDKLDEIEEMLKKWNKDKDSATDKFDDMKDQLKQMENQIMERQTKASQDDEEVKKDLKKMKNEIENISEKLTPGQKSTYKGAFLPIDQFIEGIRQLYNIREGWLAPFPWCEEFRFHLDSIFTRLKLVSRKKERGTKTDEIVSMYDIFRPHEECEQPRTVLLEGSPGMGKSTYCSKLAFDWATKKKEAEDCFPNFEVVLLLNCCDIISDLWDAIDDQLLPLDVQEQDKEEFFKFIRHNQSKVLLVLDGLDELPSSKLPQLKEIIQGRMLPKCHFVVTARQEVGVKVRECCDSLLEIEGFTKEDARLFIGKYFKASSDLAQKLLNKLKVDKDLRDLTANPLNTALLCLLCEDFQGIFPENRTDLYLDIVRCVLTRYRKKKGLPETNDDLIEIYEVQLKQLGSVALNGLFQDNMCFEDSEFGILSSELPGFEFVSAQPGRSKRRRSLRFGFLHKSFQELFAGLFLCCQLFDDEISPERLIDDTRYFNELKHVLLFTCGILACRCEEKAVVLFKSITTQVNKGFPNDFVVALQCIKECKKEHSELHVVLASALGSALELESVNLSFNQIGDAGGAALAEGIKTNSTLTGLYLSRNQIGDAGGAALAEGIKTNSTLTELYLSHNQIGDAGGAALAEGIKTNSTLTELYLSDNQIGDAGGAALAEGIKTNSTLTELDLSGNQIGDAGGAALAEGIKTNSKNCNGHF